MMVAMTQHQMLPIVLFDTSVASNNLGDEIIMDAVERIVRQTLPDAYAFRVQTHDAISAVSRAIAGRCALGIVGGSNLLKSRMRSRPLWKLTLRDALVLRNIVLLGVGYQYYDETRPSAYTRWLLGRILHRGAIHSVRDEYTKTKLAGLAHKVVNTTCPTLWELTEARCAAVSVARARAVVALLTYYAPKPDIDRALLDELACRYEKIYFWPQQFEDLAYLRSLGDYPVEVIPPSVAAYTEFLDREPVDVVGSRLHGGIRALQRGRRALVVAIDNRAPEIARDTGLPVVARTDLPAIRRWIEDPTPVRLRLPVPAIDEWRAGLVRAATAA